uniref:J domain-containing protein n=1 Tax=Ditylenchus dipsaci TaxID=166011 RepID=A0A915EKC0_9BILA
MLLVLRLLAFFASQLVGPCIGVGLAPGLYCGLDTCYEALGVEREAFNKVKDPDLVEESEKKFRLIATAYETLKDDETRTYYDYYLDNPEERYYNYYQYYRMRATPKVDVKYVILVAILLISVFQYLSGLQKHTEAMKYAKEQVKFRNMAIDIARQRGVVEFDKMGKIKKKQKNGTDPELIISGIIEENINISGGYKKQTIYDTLAWQIITLPLILFRYLAWWTVWAKKYWIQKQEYDEEAKLYLIQKHLKINSDQFLALGEKTIDDYMAKQLWKKSEFDHWKEVKDMEDKEKQNNSGKYRQYKRFLKKNAGSTISFLDE